MAQDLVVCFCEDPQNFFNGVNLSSVEEYRKHLPLFVARKFYSDRFSVLQERWQKATDRPIAENGPYLI